jgi:hypothetical protein
MQTHFPIGSWCARPFFNFVGGVDDHWSMASWNGIAAALNAGVLRKLFCSWPLSSQARPPRRLPSKSREQGLSPN